MKIVIVYSPPCSSKHLCIFCSVEHRNRNVKFWLVYMNTIVVHAITMNGFWSFQTCKSTMKVTHKSCALAIWVTTQICKRIIPIIFVIWNNELIQKSDLFTNLTWLPFSWPLMWVWNDLRVCTQWYFLLLDWILCSFEPEASYWMLVVFYLSV